MAKCIRGCTSGTATRGAVGGLCTGLLLRGSVFDLGMRAVCCFFLRAKELLTPAGWARINTDSSNVASATLAFHAKARFPHRVGSG